MSLILPPSSCYYSAHHRDLYSFPTRRSSDLNVNASATQCLIEVDVETIGASLGCAVDKVRTTHAHTSDRAHCHDGAVPLCFELLAQQDTNRYWCGEVNLCRFHGLCLVLPQFFLVTQGRSEERRVGTECTARWRR